MLQVFLVLIIAVFTTVSAQLCLKKGVLKLGELNFSFSGLFSLIPHLFQNLWLMGGLFFFGVSFFLWLLLLSKVQLSVLYPITVALNFSFITLASWVLFKEYLSPLQIFGIAVIILGIFLVVPKGSI